MVNVRKVESVPLNHCSLCLIPAGRAAMIAQGESGGHELRVARAPHRV
jgi:hypothetical protein